MPAVDLYIPTHSEPESVLTATISAAKSDLYPDLNIWICDDSEREWLRVLCNKEGVNYLRRPPQLQPRNKAGNLNWAMSHGTAPYLICLDADFQAEPGLTKNLTAFFSDPTVGLVQAPQHYRNLDPIQRNLLGGASWTEEQRFFFDISLPSRDAWNNALCVGSCWATTREALEQLNGYPTDSIVEDVYFGYCIKNIGLKTVYLNKKLATGLASLDAPSYVNQRNRWCRGAMALLSAPNGPIKAKGLTLIDRLFYLEISYYWLTHLHLLLLLFAPMIYGFLGLVVFECDSEEFMTIILPKNILFTAVFYWLSQGRCMPLITQIQKTLSVFSVTSAIYYGLRYPKDSSFAITPKESKIVSRKIHWEIASPFIAIGVLTVLSIIYTQSQNLSHFDWSDNTVFNTALTAYTLISVFLCCLTCVDKPQNLTSQYQEPPLEGNLLRTAHSVSSRIFST